MTGRPAEGDDLRARQERLELAISGSSDGIWDRDLVTDGEYFSERWCEIFGYRKDEVAPTFAAFQKLIHPDDRERVLEAVRRHLERNEPYALEYRLVTRDGDVRWVLSRGRAVRDEHGRAVRMAGSVTDITERKRAEAALIEAEERFRLLAEAASEGVLINCDGVVLDCNEQAARLFGYRAEELTGMQPEALLSPASAAVVRERGGTGETGRLELEGLRKDGTTFPISAEARVIPFRGTTARVTAIQDLTEAKRATAELQRMNRLYTALSGVNEAIVRIDSREELFREVCRVLVERGGFRMVWIGLRDRETERVGVAASHGDSTGYLEGIRIYADERPEGRGPTGTAIREGVRYVCNDFLADPRTAPWREAAARACWRASAVFPFRLDGEVIGALTVYAQEPHFFGERELGLLEEAATDLSFALGTLRHEERRREAEAEIRRMNAALEQRVAERTAQLEATNRELEAFSYSVSHDLRAPLRAIEGFSGLLEQDLGPSLEPEARRQLAIVRSSAVRMARLIEDLLAFSRSARAEIRRTAVDMTHLARSAFDETVPDPGARARIRFVLRDLPAVEGDAALLRQVWLNLLSNAVKYSRKVDSPSIEVGADPDGDGDWCWVRDNGAGFDMEYSGKLFGVFQRLHGVDEFEGTGIGLALVQRIVARHGGKVRAEGEVGRGATFSFWLPRATPPA